MRRVAAFYHRSSTDTAVFAPKQKLLEPPSHKLIIFFNDFVYYGLYVFYMSSRSVGLASVNKMRPLSHPESFFSLLFTDTFHCGGNSWGGSRYQWPHTCSRTTCWPDRHSIWSWAGTTSSQEDNIGRTFTEPAVAQSVIGIEAEMDSGSTEVHPYIHFPHKLSAQVAERKCSAVPTAFPSSKSIPLHISHLCP